MSQSIQPDMPSFEPMGRLVRARRASDADYIEATRKALIWWDRWRWVGVVFHATLIAGLMWLSVHLVKLAQDLQLMAPGQNMMAETLVLVGIGVGSSLGFSLHHCLWGLIMALSGMRSERLLLRYHATFGDLPDDSN